MYQYSGSKNKTKLRKIFLITALISIIPFLYLAVRGLTDSAGITEVDYQFGAFFYNLRTPIRTEVAIAITRIADILGQTITTVIITSILILVKKWRTGLWFGITVLLGAGLLNGLMKEVFQRVRPDQIDHLVVQGGHSFPSGHSMGSMIIYGGLLFILVRYINTQKSHGTITKIALGVVFGVLILMIGLSRIYLGVHYPSDVIGGFSLGLSWLSLAIATFGLPCTKKEFQSRNRYQFKRL